MSTLIFFDRKKAAGRYLSKIASLPRVRKIIENIQKHLFNPAVDLKRVYHSYLIK